MSIERIDSIKPAARIAHVCGLLSHEEDGAAVAYLRDECRAEHEETMSRTSAKANRAVGIKPTTPRRYTALQATKLFLRDRFLDRYTGKRLVFPGVLRLLSHLFPNEFPYHTNWKYSACHRWYWDLYPTVDHVEPVTAGGADAEANWVTTSMMRNLKKSNRALADLGWNCDGSNADDGWDGLLMWYVEYMRAHPNLMKVKPLRDWFRAAIGASEHLP